MKFSINVIALLAICLPASLCAADYTVIVNADGTYDPAWLNIHDGDTVH